MTKQYLINFFQYNGYTKQQSINLVNKNYHKYITEINETLLQFVTK